MGTRPRGEGSDRNNPDDVWEMIEYPDAIRDKSTGQWISKAEVAEAPFVVFRSRKLVEQVEERLVVRRIPELNPKQVEQPTLRNTYRHHAFFTTTHAPPSTATT